MDFLLSIDNFEGPMDLLLHLVKETKLDIIDIKMSEIIDSYLAYIHNLKNLNIDVSSSFLVMASSLIHIKSKKLIGKTNEEDEEDEFSITSEEDLKNKIIAYEQYKNLTSSFQELEEKRMQVYTKLPENLKNYQPDYELTNTQNLNAQSLGTLMEEILKQLKNKEPKETRITKKEISIESRKIWIRKKLENQEKCEFSTLFEEPSKPCIIATLLAILIMSKENTIKLTQEKLFDLIWIWRM